MNQTLPMGRGQRVESASSLSSPRYVERARLRPKPRAERTHNSKTVRLASELIRLVNVVVRLAA